MSNPSSKSNLIYGARVVLEAMEAGRDIEKIFIRKDLNSELRKDVMDQAKQSGVLVQVVPVEKIERMVRGANHQGVVARVPMIAFVELEDLLEKLVEGDKVPLLIALDQVSDVRNFGAIARSAECMGADAIIVPQQGAAQINADAIKISAGALHHLPVARVRHIKDLIFTVQSYDIQVVACTEKADGTIFDADFSGPTLLIFGSEEKGISPGVLKTSDVQAKIPMSGQIASLNVSVAVGMTLLEATRQRL